MDRQECLSYFKKGDAMPDCYQSVEEIAAVVRGFENCTTPKDQFTHRSHLTVATYYLYTSTPDETFAKMRLGLQRFLDHHGVDPAKYSDRVTRLWIQQVQNVCEQIGPAATLLATTNAVLDRLGDSRIAVAPDTETN